MVGRLAGRLHGGGAVTRGFELVWRLVRIVVGSRQAGTQLVACTGAQDYPNAMLRELF